jgi:hypothetical protein
MSVSGRSHGHAASGNGNWRGSRSRPARLIGAALLIAVVGVALGLTVPTEVRATASYLAPASVRYAVHQDEQEACLYSLIRQRVPKGARVYVHSQVTAHIQALAELSALWAVPVLSPAKAQFEIDYVHGPGGCHNVGLWVRRVRGGHS